MRNISKEAIESKILGLIKREESLLEEITLDDILPTEENSTIDLSSFYEALEGSKVEMRQINRLEKIRLETLQTFLNEEQKAKTELLEKIDQLTTESEKLKSKSLIESIIELQDYVERFEKSLPLFSQRKKRSSLFQRAEDDEFTGHLREGVSAIGKKIGRLLEKEDVFPLLSDNILFDPAGMIALETCFDEREPDQRVLKTLEKGYTHKGKVVRFAKVKVNNHPAKKEEI